MEIIHISKQPLDHRRRVNIQKRLITLICMGQNLLQNIYKNVTLACVASVSVRFGSKELQRKNPILLLPNPTETLATQANVTQN